MTPGDVFGVEGLFWGKSGIVQLNSSAPMGASERKRSQRGAAKFGKIFQARENSSIRCREPIHVIDTCCFPNLLRSRAVLSHVLPLSAPCAQAYIHKEEDQLSFSSECPRFRQRSGRGGKNLSMLSAALR